MPLALCAPPYNLLKATTDPKDAKPPLGFATNLTIVNISILRSFPKLFSGGRTVAGTACGRKRI